MGQEPEQTPYAQAFLSLSLARWTSALSVIGLIALAVAGCGFTAWFHAIPDTVASYDRFGRPFEQALFWSALLLVASSLAGRWCPHPQLRKVHGIVLILCGVSAVLVFSLGWLFGLGVFLATPLLAVSAICYASVVVVSAGDAWQERFRPGLVWAGPWALAGCVLCIAVLLLLHKSGALGWAKAID